MAHLPETATWDDGVYQLETTDPVLGGPNGTSNTPLKNLANRTAFLKAQLSISTPPGMVAHFARNTAPTGWLKANGSAVSRTTYANLFAAIGTTFGPGDGLTTFTLPDLRAEFIRGWDDGRGVDASRAFGAAQSDELKAHKHTYEGRGSYLNGGYETPVLDSNGDSWFNNTTTTGGTETRPRNIALLTCIKY